MENDKTDKTDKTGDAEEKLAELLGRPSRRRIVLSDKADIVRTDDDGNETTQESYRAVFVLLDSLNDMPNDGKYDIFLKEDEERSDLPGKGEERYRRSLFKDGPVTKPEAMKFLAENYMDPRRCVLEFQKLCTAMAFHSQLKNVMVTMVFDGSRPSGFTFFTDCAQQTVSDIEALGNASRKMADGYMEDMRKQHPNEVSFDYDGDIILPNSVDAAKLARSAATAQRLLKGMSTGK